MDKYKYIYFSFCPYKDFKMPSIPTLKIPLSAVFDDLDIEVEEDELKTRGNESKIQHFIDLYFVCPSPSLFSTYTLVLF